MLQEARQRYVLYKFIMYISRIPKWIYNNIKQISVSLAIVEWGMDYKKLQGSSCVW